MRAPAQALLLLAMIPAPVPAARAQSSAGGVAGFGPSLVDDEAERRRPGATVQQESRPATPLRPARPLSTEPGSAERLAQLESLARQIQGQLEALRGREYPGEVELRFLEDEELARRVRSRFEGSFTPRRLQELELVAKLLGMLDARENLRAWFDRIPGGSPGAFYDVGEDLLYVSDDLDPGTARLLMVLELARALEDQLHGIDSRRDLYEADTDGWMAHQAVVQGALSTLLGLWLDRHVPEFGLVSLARMFEAQSRALGSAPPFVWRPVFAMQLRGESFLRRTHLVDLNASDVRMRDIDRALAEPPRSTEQILHPVKYWRRARLDEPRLLRLAPVELPPGAVLLREDTLGELYLGILTLSAEEREVFTERSIVDLISERYTTDASDGWGGDRYALVQKEDGGLLVHLVTTWDTVSDAREFFLAMEGLRTVIEGSKRELFDLGAGFSGLGVHYDGFDRVSVSSWVGMEQAFAMDLIEALAFEVIESE